ncbi:hypothetical protein [Flagellimonas sp. CMM7]|uniref:hypothetical protein n=1 Tax=Flagellimonas sp. CMM7 TaxID=2654676 RepID=UPI0013D83B57|nr:hypothetical protein [Flagellimonas sp. CMM7]UII80000.1 hypothetical protein LV704_00415 [Flagellimonas sp. CMM7]
MKVFLPVSTTQELRVRPRRKSYNVDLVLRKEITDSVVTYPLTGVYSNGFLILNVIHQFEEGESYEVKVNDDNGDIWRGKAFVTSQPPEKYKSNNDILTA